jgi:hypothetical protein
MSRTGLRKGARNWGIAAASLSLLAGVAAAVGTAPAAVSAEPDGDCAEAFPVDELEKGDLVEGLTVTEGTAPQVFTGTYMRAIENGIAEDLDMLMFELDMPEFARTKGIWQGMSGSPVYAADGRLIGAVSYGLSWGPSPIAGVTPFEDMDDYMGAAPAKKVEVDRATARLLARETNVTVAQAEQDFTRLQVPLGISGLRSDRLTKAAAVKKPYALKGVHSIGRASSAAAGPETIEAGGNLAASVAYGDVTMAGVGTATSVCHGQVVGFGHPLAFLGETTLTMHPADALFIQPESLGAPFKVANLGAPAGTINQDRLAGIAGPLGDVPDTADISVGVGYRGKARNGGTRVSMADWTADALFGQFLSTHDRTLDGIVKGSTVQGWTITGTRPNGKPFALKFADRHTSKRDITWDSVFDLADLVYSLSAVPGVTINSVDVTSDVNDETGTWKVSSVEQRRAGGWQKLSRKAPALVRAGKTLRLRTVLKGPAGSKTVPVSFKVPRRAKKNIALLSVAGGNDLYNDGWVRSVNEAEKMLGSAVRNDQLRVQFGTPNRIGYDGYDEDEDISFGRQRRYSFVKSRLLGPLDQVINGGRMIQVVVR